MTLSAVVMRGRSAACALVAALLSGTGVGAGGARVGFCLDNVPDALIGTGFTAPSTVLREDRCILNGYAWCPLLNRTARWEQANGSVVEYYWFSVCCVGGQGARLMPDDGGMPSCRGTLDSGACTRSQWHAKFMYDFLGEGSGYEYQVSPFSMKGTPLEPMAHWKEPPCVCRPSSPSCVASNADGSRCLKCTTDAPCGGDEVRFGLNLYKLHSVDLKTTEISFSAWVRQEWYDTRLAYNHQCYGGNNYFEVQAEAGSLENSLIWTPDIELYNSRNTIWQGSFHARSAAVYACGDATPGTGGCGYVYWSRPGMLQALCKYEGLWNFPWDRLSCGLEFGAWVVDGRYQDILPKADDGGILWPGKPGAGDPGLVSGTSFQDYRFDRVDVQRVIAYYGSAPYPEILYTVYFRRSTDYYVLKLIVPAVLLTWLSFAAFFMSPATGERLGFGVTVILAMFALDITAASMMPMCNEKLQIDYLHLVCLAFTCSSLLETAVVLYMYHQVSETIVEAFIPNIFIKVFAGKWRELFRRRRHPKVKKDDVPLHERSQGLLYRRSLYRQVFDVLDENCDGSIYVSAVDDFLKYLLGPDWSQRDGEGWIFVESRQKDYLMREPAFLELCEFHLTDTRGSPVIDHLPDMVNYWITSQGRYKERIIGRWRRRALEVDWIARWAFPLSFVVWLICFAILETEDMAHITKDNPSVSYLFPLMWMPFVALLYAFAYFSMWVMRKYQDNEPWPAWFERSFSVHGSRVSVKVADSDAGSPSEFDESDSDAGSPVKASAERPAVRGCSRAVVQDRGSRPPHACRNF